MLVVGTKFRFPSLSMAEVIRKMSLISSPLKPRSSKAF
jgi:hypothetical protein